jgi:hypothetical protein
MTWIDLAGRGEPVIVVDGTVHHQPDDVDDPELRQAAVELWAEFERVRHLAEPIAEALARFADRAGRPVSLRFPDRTTFEAELEG